MTPMIEVHEAYDGKCWVETFSGALFSPQEPEFTIPDISHALSMNCRFNGHVSQFQSVAEHSVVVSILMEEFTGGDPMEGLLHDALEAYLTDVPAPIKKLLPDWKKLDKQLEVALREQFNLPATKSQGCQEADWLSLFIEAYYLLPSQGTGFADPHDLRPKALDLIDKGWRCLNLTPEEAKSAFLQRYHALSP